MCRAVFITEVLDFMTDSVLGLQNNARIAMLKKISIYTEKTNRASTRKNIYISNPNPKCTPIHKSANPTNKDCRFSCVCLWLRDLFFFLSFIYLNVHTFCAEHCCSIFLIFKVTLFAVLSLEKWHALPWAPKNKGIELRQCNYLEKGRGYLSNCIKTGLSSYLSIGVMTPPPPRFTAKRSCRYLESKHWFHEVKNMKWFKDIAAPLCVEKLRW